MDPSKHSDSTTPSPLSSPSCGPQLPMDDFIGPLKALSDFGAGQKPQEKLNLRKSVMINPLCRPVLPSQLEGPEAQIGKYDNVGKHIRKVKSRESKNTNIEFGIYEDDPDWEIIDENRFGMERETKRDNKTQIEKEGDEDIRRYLLNQMREGSKEEGIQGLYYQNYGGRREIDEYPIVREPQNHANYEGRVLSASGVKDTNMWVYDGEEYEYGDTCNAEYVDVPQRHVRTPTRIVKRSQSHSVTRSSGKNNRGMTKSQYQRDLYYNVDSAHNQQAQSQSYNRGIESQPQYYEDYQEVYVPYSGGKEDYGYNDNVMGRSLTPQRTQNVGAGVYVEHRLKVATRNYTPGEVIPPHVAKNLKEKKARKADPVSSYTKYRKIWNKNRTGTSKK